MMLYNCTSLHHPNILHLPIALLTDHITTYIIDTSLTSVLPETEPILTW